MRDIQRTKTERLRGETEELQVDDEDRIKPEVDRSFNSNYTINEVDLHIQVLQRKLIA